MITEFISHTSSRSSSAKTYPVRIRAVMPQDKIQRDMFRKAIAETLQEIQQGKVQTAEGAVTLFRVRAGVVLLRPAWRETGELLEQYFSDSDSVDAVAEKLNMLVVIF
jgi:hypothetical protein